MKHRIRYTIIGREEPITVMREDMTGIMEALNDRTNDYINLDGELIKRTLVAGVKDLDKGLRVSEEYLRNHPEHR